MQYISTVYTTRMMEYGMLSSTGMVGDFYDNAMAESADGAYKTELVWRREPFQNLRDLELAMFRWVSWWNSKRLHQSLGYRTSEQIETEYYAKQAVQAAHYKGGTKIRPLHTVFAIWTNVIGSFCLARRTVEPITIAPCGRSDNPNICKASSCEGKAISGMPLCTTLNLWGLSI